MIKSEWEIQLYSNIMTKIEAENIKKDCKKLTTKAALLSAGGGAIPLPGVDIGTDIAILIRILPKISNRFGLSKKQIDELDERKRLLIFKAIKTVGAELVGRVITKDILITILKRMGIKITSRQIAKYIPILGTLISSGISYASMKIVTNMHINQCYGVVSEVNGFINE
jgi:uncharacterized protein (DUF697 family)